MALISTNQTTEFRIKISWVMPLHFLPGAATPQPQPSTTLATCTLCAFILLHSHRCRSPHLPSPSGSLGTNFTTASSHGSKDALAILDLLITPAALLFDPKYTSQQRHSPKIPFGTFPPSPTSQRLPPSLPSTISVQNLDTRESAVTMDKRHPSSFQQLEKLGEGTYATVCKGREGTLSSKKALWLWVAAFVATRTMLILTGLQRSKSTNR